MAKNVSRINMDSDQIMANDARTSTQPETRTPDQAIQGPETRNRKLQKTQEKGPSGVIKPPKLKTANLKAVLTQEVLKKSGKERPTVQDRLEDRTDLVKDKRTDTHLQNRGIKGNFYTLDQLGDPEVFSQYITEYRSNQNTKNGLVVYGPLRNRMVTHNDGTAVSVAEFNEMNAIMTQNMMVQAVVINHASKSMTRDMRPFIRDPSAPGVHKRFALEKTMYELGKALRNDFDFRSDTLEGGEANVEALITTLNRMCGLAYFHKEFRNTGEGEFDNGFEGISKLLRVLNVTDVLPTHTVLPESTLDKMMYNGRNYVGMSFADFTNGYENTNFKFRLYLKIIATWELKTYTDLFIRLNLISVLNFDRPHGKFLFRRTLKKKIKPYLTKMIEQHKVLMSIIYSNFYMPRFDIYAGHHDILDKDWADAYQTATIWTRGTEDESGNAVAGVWSGDYGLEDNRWN